MASSGSSLPVTVQKQWFDIRDTFPGLDEQSFSRALQLAATCDHPEARWLVTAFVGKSRQEARDFVFSLLGKDDCFLGFAFGGMSEADCHARILCIAWLFEQDWGDLTRLRRSAELGYAFAQACLAGQLVDSAERQIFAALAASQGERNGFLIVGIQLARCEASDLDASRQHLLKAYELGIDVAASELGETFPACDPRKWHWLGLAAKAGQGSFTQSFAEQVAKFESGSGNAAVVFAIGQVLHGLNALAKTIFCDSDDFGARIGPAMRAIAFYECQIKNCRDAVHAWTRVGIRFGVVKDIRIVIGGLIWESRAEALYPTLLF